MEQTMKSNPLGNVPVKKLLNQFAVPSIIAMLVSALYNIVDQFFIGRSVGQLGNAATNIAFPLSVSCVALALLFGIGGASAFNLTMGAGEREKAGNYIGNSVVLLFGSGLILCLITQLFLNPLLVFFGSPEDVLGYAKTYTRITAFGFPFVIFATGGGHLVRADGSPRFTMISNLTGAIVNTILFIIGISQGLQPIVSFNYGAGKYERVKHVYKLAFLYGLVLFPKLHSADYFKLLYCNRKAKKRYYFTHTRISSEPV